MSLKPTIGVSSCLLGEQVRFNGGHKESHWLTQELSKAANFKSFCPEIGIGLPVPRPALRLISSDKTIRAVDSQTHSKDVTDDLVQYYQAEENNISKLDGYIVMQGSPSCGLERVKSYNDNMIPTKNAVGIYTAEITKNHPNLPIEEAGRLNDAHLAECFLTSVFVFHEWQQTKPFQSAKALIQFHSKHKFLVMLHSNKTYRSLGQLLANLSDPLELSAIADRYIAELMACLKNVSSAGHRTNTLLHLYGYLKNLLTTPEKESIIGLIDQYRTAQIPYVVPLTLLKHYAQIHQSTSRYIWNQSVWSPYPQHLNKYSQVI